MNEMDSHRETNRHAVGTNICLHYEKCNSIAIRIVAIVERLAQNDLVIRRLIFINIMPSFEIKSNQSMSGYSMVFNDIQRHPICIQWIDCTIKLFSPLIPIESQCLSNKVIRRFLTTIKGKIKCH